MRNWLPALVCVPMVIVGCSQLPTRARPPHPGSPNQVVPSTPGSPLTPVPDLGPATPALPGGPSLEGPLFPDSAGRVRRKAFVRPASAARRPAVRSVPLGGYVELPPSP
jgi:hypothetical protein